MLDLDGVNLEAGSSILLATQVQGFQEIEVTLTTKL
jgi:hypothetical protein